VVTSVLFSAFIIIAEIFIPYHKYVRVLKYLVLSLFAYVITAVIVGGNINQIFFTIIPSISFSSDYAIMFVAVIGTTISPCLLFQSLMLILFNYRFFRSDSYKLCEGIVNA
jgi:Mn2+/Fe2+ NRAMP family transporter